MKLLNVEFKEKTSQGIYCNVTYKTLFGKVKTKEAFLKVYWKENNDNTYLSFPKWVENGNDVFMYNTIANQMIRVYEQTIKTIRK